MRIAQFERLLNGRFAVCVCQTMINFVADSKSEWIVRKVQFAPSRIGVVNDACTGRESLESLKDALRTFRHQRWDRRQYPLGVLQCYVTGPILWQQIALAKAMKLVG